MNNAPDAPALAEAWPDRLKAPGKAAIRCRTAGHMVAAEDPCRRKIRDLSITMQPGSCGTSGWSAAGGGS